MPPRRVYASWRVAILGCTLGGHCTSGRCIVEEECVDEESLVTTRLWRRAAGISTRLCRSPFVTAVEEELQQNIHLICWPKNVHLRNKCRETRKRIAITARYGIRGIWEVSWQMGRTKNKNDRDLDHMWHTPVVNGIVSGVGRISRRKDGQGLYKLKRVDDNDAQNDEEYRRRHFTKKL